MGEVLGARLGRVALVGDSVVGALSQSIALAIGDLGNVLVLSAVVDDDRLCVGDLNALVVILVFRVDGLLVDGVGRYNLVGVVALAGDGHLDFADAGEVVRRNAIALVGNLVVGALSKFVLVRVQNHGVPLLRLAAVDRILGALDLHVAIVRRVRVDGLRLDGVAHLHFASVVAGARYKGFHRACVGEVVVFELNHVVNAIDQGLLAIGDNRELLLDSAVVHHVAKLGDSNATISCVLVVDGLRKDRVLGMHLAGVVAHALDGHDLLISVREVGGLVLNGVVRVLGQSLTRTVGDLGSPLMLLAVVHPILGVVDLNTSVGFVIPIDGLRKDLVGRLDRAGVIAHALDGHGNVTGINGVIAVGNRVVGVLNKRRAVLMGKHGLLLLALAAVHHVGGSLDRYIKVLLLVRGIDGLRDDGIGLFHRALIVASAGDGGLDAARMGEVLGARLSRIALVGNGVVGVLGQSIALAIGDLGNVLVLSAVVDDNRVHVGDLNAQVGILVLGIDGLLAYLVGLLHRAGVVALAGDGHVHLADIGEVFGAVGNRVVGALNKLVAACVLHLRVPLLGLAAVNRVVNAQNLRIAVVRRVRIDGLRLDGQVARSRRSVVVKGSQVNRGNMIRACLGRGRVPHVRIASLCLADIQCPNLAGINRFGACSNGERRLSLAATVHHGLVIARGAVEGNGQGRVHAGNGERTDNGLGIIVAADVGNGLRVIARFGGSFLAGIWLARSRADEAAGNVALAGDVYAALEQAGREVEALGLIHGDRAAGKLVLELQLNILGRGSNGKVAHRNIVGVVGVHAHRSHGVQASIGGSAANHDGGVHDTRSDLVHRFKHGADARADIGSIVDAQSPKHILYLVQIAQELVGGELVAEYLSDNILQRIMDGRAVIKGHGAEIDAQIGIAGAIDADDGISRPCLFRVRRHKIAGRFAIGNALGVDGYLGIALGDFHGNLKLAALVVFVACVLDGQALRANLAIEAAVVERNFGARDFRASLISEHLGGKLGLDGLLQVFLGSVLNRNGFVRGQMRGSAAINDADAYLARAKATVLRVARVGDADGLVILVAELV